MNEREHDYFGSVVWTGAKHGPTLSYTSYSREYELAFAGKAPLRGSADRLFRGDAALYNPEEFLLGALSACHLLAYLALCSREGIGVVSYIDRPQGKMLERGGAGRFAEVILHPECTIKDSRVERALALHDRAHKECFIANSVNFPVTHRPEILRAP